MAMTLDAMDLSHPVEVPVKHPGEVNEIFDTISYKKGCSLIRMLYAWIGDGNFRQGMHNYLKRFSYSAASTEDLWTELESASGLPVREAMQDWTGCMGFPLIEVEIASESETEMTLKLTQSKFSATGSSDPSGKIWHVPMEINSPGGIQKCLMDTKEYTVKIQNLKTANSFVMINSGSAGFFHVKYSPELSNRLMANLISLSTIDRLKLSSDLFCLCRAGLESSVKYLELFKAYSAETEYAVLSDILDGISVFKSFAEHLGVNNELNSVIIETITTAANKIGWE